jgi:hypothetical protein
MNTNMKNCFDSYIGGVPGSRSIEMQFKWPMALFDEYENIVRRVN